MPTFASREDNLHDFADARLGLFIHFGLYSLLGRGEWVLNKEQIPIEQYRRFADRFTADRFDADGIVEKARAAGCRYACLTTMHHDGFCLYDSQVNPFNSVTTACGRDLVAEFVEACRKHDLRVHLYHSLNHWTTTPDGADALEDESAQAEFVDFAHARIHELVTRFNPIECLWYDGWWPFNAEGWRAEAMNAMVREIQPHILFNGRNGLPGDFATPEGHLSAPRPWRPWEACMTHNDNWGFHAGDHHWKSHATVIDMLTQVAAGAGNLLINVGPDGSGALPEPTVSMLDALADWTARYDEALWGTRNFAFDLQTRHDGDRGDWMHAGRFTTTDNTLYAHLFCWPGETFTFSGLEANVESARMLGDDRTLAVSQDNGRVVISGLPDRPDDPLGAVIAIECDRPPSLYKTGGMREPDAEHPRYDPCPSDLMA